jgi:FAD/FMN-containing dehydrogenase
MPGGTFGDTGVAGLTLGGGIGHLSAKHGLTLDNLIAVRLVNAAGEEMLVSDETESELFWALRGGGGNFGVVTEFTFRLQPVGPLYGGAIDFGLDDAASVLRAWRDVMTDPPDGFQSFALLFRNPFTGLAGLNLSITDLDGDVGPEVVARLTGERTPQRVEVRTMGYPELQNIYARLPFGLRNYWSGRFLRELPDEVLDLAVELIVGRGESGSVLFEPLQGEVARVAPEATAFAGREARWNATFTSVWVDPAEDERRIELARTFSRGLMPWALGGGYLNYASEASDGVEAAFGAERFARLRAVKRAFDPGNMFRFNHNISPD